jgi:hypothetical protein
LSFPWKYSGFQYGSPSLCRVSSCPVEIFKLSILVRFNFLTKARLLIIKESIWAISIFISFVCLLKLWICHYWDEEIALVLCTGKACSKCVVGVPILFTPSTLKFLYLNGLIASQEIYFLSYDQCVFSTYSFVT